MHSESSGDNDDKEERQNALLDAMAVGMDREALRFIAFCADRLVHHVNPGHADKMLDVATGTGALALAASQAVGPAGRVTAIDTAENLLTRLSAKIQQFGIRNIDVHNMAATRLEFRQKYFQHVTCSLGLFWLSNPQAAVREWVRVTRPGGSVNVATFGVQAFQPLAGLLQQALAGLAGNVSATLPWAHLAAPETLRSLLEDAGLVDVEVHAEQLGYHLRDAQEWWEVVSHSGLRLMVEQVPKNRRERLQAEHLAQVVSLVNADGLWLDLPVLFARGRRPA